jgi:hypothetical protein
VTRPKDSQRGRLYAAEREAFRAFPGLADVATPARYERRVKDIMASKWMLDTYPRAMLREVECEFSAVMGGADATSRRIRTGPRSMNEWVLVHELCHVIHARLGDSYDHAGHGRHYAEIYVTVARRFLGAEAYAALRAAFRKHQVKVGPKRVVAKRAMPAGAFDALAKAREARTAKAARAFLDKLVQQGVEKKLASNWFVFASATIAGKIEYSAKYRWDWTLRPAYVVQMISHDERDAWDAWKAWIAQFESL